MAAQKLQNARVKATDVFYLDTSALYSLVLVAAEKAGHAGAAPVEHTRKKNLDTFFKS